MKKLWLYIFIPIALLVACTGQQVLNSVETFKNTDIDKQTNVVYDSITENQFTDIEMDEIRDLINSMEAETPEIKYTDMDQSLLEFYTRPIKNYYKFLGRFANNGYAYILGISKTESAVLRDLDCRVEEIGYVQLGKWIDSRMDNEENFDKIYDFPGILSFYQSKDGKFLYLGIRQYSDLDDIKYSGMNIGKVFNEIVNDNRLEYISQLHEKQLRALKPFKTPYISMYKWEHGEDFYAYKPISYDELTKITDDKSKVEPSKINSECVGLYDYDGEPMPFMDSINQSLYEKIEDFYEVRSLDEIRDTYKFNETCQETVPQALRAFFESTGFEDAIRNAISIGGDSDTLAAICGGIAEAYYGIPKEIRKQALTFLDERLLNLLIEFENVYSPIIEG